MLVLRRAAIELRHGNPRTVERGIGFYGVAQDTLGSRVVNPVLKQARVRQISPGRRNSDNLIGDAARFPLIPSRNARRFPGEHHLHQHGVDISWINRQRSIHFAIHAMHVHDALHDVRDIGGHRAGFRKLAVIGGQLPIECHGTLGFVNGTKQVPKAFFDLRHPCMRLRIIWIGLEPRRHNLTRPLPMARFDQPIHRRGHLTRREYGCAHQ
jgi:hypothetical protein